MRRRLSRAVFGLLLTGACLVPARAELDPEDYLGVPPPELSPREREAIEAAIREAQEEARRRAEEQARAEEEARRARQAELAALPNAARLTLQRCLDCHAASTYEGRRYTRLSAEMTILRMQWLHGARLERGERTVIAGHLAGEHPAPAGRKALDAVAPAALALAGWGLWRTVKRRRRISREGHDA
jgi:hypothetical protein